MKTTFLNQNSENNLEEIGLNHLNSRAEDFKFFEIFGHIEDEDDFVERLKEQDFNLEEIKDAISKFEDTSRFYDYGLDFSFVSAGTFEDQKEGYYRYQLSWGGPSDEVRFYEDGTIEYCFFDWFCGVGFDVSNEDWAIFLEDNFKEIGSIDFDSLEPEQKEIFDFEEEEEK